MLKPIYFEDGEAFRKWLRANHTNAAEVWVGYHRVRRKKPSMTWSESVDEALCYGWIDGIRKTVDEDRYKIRFTPRRPRSHWSKVNIDKVASLIAKKRMRKAGLAAYDRRTDARSGTDAHENDSPELNAAKKKRLKADRAAWAFFDAQPPGYKKGAQFWVMSAKREETRERRFEQLLTHSRAGERIPPLQKR